MTNGVDGSLPEEAERLKAFLGEWSVAGTLDMEESSAAVAGRWVFVEAVEGWGVRGIMETEIEGWGAFQESELIGFDSAEGMIHLFSMNKYAIRDHSGGWVSENKLVVHYRGVQDGKEVTEEITVDFEAPGRMVGHVIEQADGVVVVTTELTMAQQG